MKVFVFVFALSVMLPHTFAINISPGHAVDIVKRHLRWNANKDIVSSIAARNNLKIDYLQPHSGSVGVSDTSAIYMAFTLYKRNGALIVLNEGVFYFIDLNTASFRSKCSPSTNHAGAYYHFYGTCPSGYAGIVASGWFYDGSRGGLVYNSYNFNSGPSNYRKPPQTTANNPKPPKTSNKTTANHPKTRQTT